MQARIHFQFFSFFNAEMHQFSGKL